MTALLIEPRDFLLRTALSGCGLFALGGSTGVVFSWIRKSRNDDARWFLALGSISVSLLIWVFAFRFYGESIAAIFDPLLEQHARFLSDLVHFRW
jgi:hypothetical protein